MTSAEVCEYTGLTFRMLDHYCRSGRIPGVTTDGSGVPRSFTTRQAQRLRVIAACRRAGLELDLACRIAADTLTGKTTHDLDGGLTLTLPAALIAYDPPLAVV